MEEFNELKEQIKEWFSREHLEQMFSRENLEELFTREKLMRWLPIAVPCVTLLIVLIVLLSTCGAQKPPQQSGGAPVLPGLKPVSRDIRAEEIQGEVQVYRGETTIAPVNYGLVLSDGDSAATGSGSELLITLDGDKKVYAEENTVYRLSASGRMGSTVTSFYLTQGGLLCRLSNSLKDGEQFIAETPSCTASASQAVFRISVVTGETNYTMVQVFSGNASVTIKDTGVKLTLYSGQCALVQNSQRFVLDDEIDTSFWRSGQAWNLQVKQDGSGRSTLAIPYEKLPAGTLRQMIRMTEEKQKLILGKDALETLLETGHNYQETVMQAPSCDQKGHSRYHCALCSDTYEADTDAKGHEPVEDPGTEATCTRAGRSDGSHCRVCNAILKAQKTIEPLGHNLLIKEAKEATCTKDGLTEGRSCQVCGEVLSIQTVIPKTGHTVVIDAAVEPTCSAVGYTQGSHCSTCNEIITERKPLDKTEHKPVTDPAVEATCSKEGLTEGSHCSVCNEILKKQETVPKKEHTVVTDPAVEATCSKEGLTEGSHCSACKAVLKKQEIVPKKEHTKVVDPAVSASCASDGLTEGSHCGVCGAVMTARQTIPGGHKTEAVARDEITDEACGKVDYVCTVCGAVVRTENKSHSISQETVTHEDGSQTTIRKCSVCGRQFS